MRPSYRVAMQRCARELRVVILLAAAATALCGGDVWSKEYTQWSAQDVNRLLTDSPWARQINALFSTAPHEVDDTVVPPPSASTANMGGTHGVSSGGWDGGVGRNIDDTPPKLPVTIRWDSALPVREALLRSPAGDHVSALGDSSQNLNQPEKDYIVTVIGLLTSDQSKDRERVQKELMQAAKLVRAGKPVIRAENVELDASAGAIRVFFPRTAPISLNDKEVTFELQFGSMTIEKKFRLKAMTYRGKLEL